MFPSWRRLVRPQDVVWLLLFTALAVASPEPGPIVPAMLVALGVLQVLKPRMRPIVSIPIELALCYVLIGFGGALSSSFYPILFLPVISAASNFGLRGFVLASIGASAVYLSFLTLLNWQTEYIDQEAFFELTLRVLWFPVVGFLTYELAKATRAQTRKAEAAAADLAKANQSLQEAEAEVRRSERLAALGQLTAGLAHELRNPLGTMKSSAELLQRQVAGENEIAREMAGFIATEVDRTNQLITRFLAFARPQHLQLKKGDLAELLDHVVERFKRESSGTVSVYRNDSPDIPPVAFDEQLMENALLNLVQNAAQASPPNAVVTIKTRLIETGAGPNVEIAVIDRGSGIDPKNLESIFNPFFTTKSDGVGLGLAIVSKIIDEHGGQITVESTPGEGSVFHVFLPVRE